MGKELRVLKDSMDKIQLNLPNDRLHALEMNLDIQSSQLSELLVRTGDLYALATK